MPAHRATLAAALVATLLITACAGGAASPAASPAQAPASSAVPHTHADSAVVIRPEPNTPALSFPLEPAGGQVLGSTYQAFLTPHQEPGEERDTPAFIPTEFRSTKPSLLRSQRHSQGHGVLRFSRDLSRAYVDVRVEGIDPAEIVMFHIHCGRPDQLGPIIVDFAHFTNLQTNFADGVFSAEITNADIEVTSSSGEGVVGVLTAGCPILPGLPDKVKTIAGMEYIARQGELYFNLHTSGQVYFGDIRGQLASVRLE
jgi:CHRD domain